MCAVRSVRRSYSMSRERVIRTQRMAYWATPLPTATVSRIATRRSAAL